MSNFEMTGKATSDFELPNTGIVSAVCINVVDGRYTKNTYMGQDKGWARKIWILWEIEQRITKGQFAGQHMVISKEYTFAVGEKANLRKDVEGWRGKKFEERKNADGTISLLTEKKQNGKIVKIPFAVDMLINANCLLYLEDVGKTKSFIKPTKIMRFEGNNHIAVKREITPNYVPDWLQKIIQERPITNPDLNNQGNNNVSQNANVNNAIDTIEEEEIPF